MFVECLVFDVLFAARAVLDARNTAVNRIEQKSSCPCGLYLFIRKF